MTDLIERFDPFLKSLPALKKIETPVAYTAAATALIEVKTALKTVEEKKTAITAPARKVAQEAAALFSEVEKGLEHAEAHLKQLLADYIDERLPAAAQEASVAVNAGDKTALQAALTALPNVEGIGLSTETSFDIIDFEAIPKQYLKVEVDRKAVLTALRRGVDIPGIIEKNRTRISVTVKG